MPVRSSRRLFLLPFRYFAFFSRRGCLPCELYPPPLRCWSRIIIGPTGPQAITVFTGALIINDCDNSSQVIVPFRLAPPKSRELYFRVPCTTLIPSPPSPIHSKSLGCYRKRRCRPCHSVQFSDTAGHSPRQRLRWRRLRFRRNRCIMDCHIVLARCPPGCRWNQGVEIDNRNRNRSIDRRL